MKELGAVLWATLWAREGALLSCLSCLAVDTDAILLAASMVRISGLVIEREELNRDRISDPATERAGTYSIWRGSTVCDRDKDTCEGAGA